MRSQAATRVGDAGPRHSLPRAWLSGLLLILAQAPVPAGPAADDRLAIDTRALTLSVMSGDRPRVTLHDIAIGRHGASAQKLRGDGTTPLGRFRVVSIGRSSRFRRFIALDYPDVERAQKARDDGTIGERELRAIVAAHRKGHRPPQDGVLGGQIGIHGLGAADPDIHAAMHWTRGCVALTDRQIDGLLHWIYPGMPVEIR